MGEIVRKGSNEPAFKKLVKRGDFCLTGVMASDWHDLITMCIFRCFWVRYYQPMLMFYIPMFHVKLFFQGCLGKDMRRNFDVKFYFVYNKQCSLAIFQFVLIKNLLRVPAVAGLHDFLDPGGLQ